LLTKQDALKEAFRNSQAFGTYSSMAPLNYEIISNNDETVGDNKEIPPQYKTVTEAKLNSKRSSRSKSIEQKIKKIQGIKGIEKKIIPVFMRTNGFMLQNEAES